MQKLIVHGDLDIRKGAVIEYDDRELVCFGINKQGTWHGPEEPQLWCTVGREEEKETYERREYIPMHLDVESVEPEEISVLEASG